ncbi:cyclic nucleotide-binding domain-containing protein [Castellaniella hirudinis]|uniref:Small-conductance mechanosensitive channel n=1 Tax=Castellaniella hirudinis TaxID=1144617 RepID=A0ABV8RXT8_9BURK
MMAFVSAVAHHFSTLWAPSDLWLLALSLVLGLALGRVARRMPSWTVLVLLLVVLLLLGSAVALTAQDAPLARALQGTAVLLLGLWLIRQMGLTIFRGLLPRLHVHPPRILEELLILFAYVGWGLLRLSQAGLDLGGLVAGTAVLTAVVAFAMQDTLGNILSGVALQLDHSLHIGDWLELADFEGEVIAGEVVQVQWRHTAVRTIAGEMLLIPNSQLMKGHVKLVGGPSVPVRQRMIMFHAEASVLASEVITEVERVLREAESAAVARDPAPRCQIADLTDGRITYAVRYGLTDPRAPAGTDSWVRQHVQAVFVRRGWSLAAPVRTLNGTARASASTEAGRAPDELDARVQCLRDVDLFQPLTDGERLDLARRLKTMPFVPGGLVVRQGEQGDCLYIVLKGRAAVWLETQGRQRLLAEVGPGHVIGEMSLMTGDPRRASLRALSPMVCYALFKADFQSILESRPALAEMFAQLLARRSLELEALRNEAPAAAPAERAEGAAILARIRHFFGIA